MAAEGAAVGGADAAGGHPTTSLNETVHQRHRLGILTITSRARQADFSYLREALGLTSGNLSTHLTVLEDAGLVRVEKGYEGRRPRTWVSITRGPRGAERRDGRTDPARSRRTARSRARIYLEAAMSGKMSTQLPERAAGTACRGPAARRDAGHRGRTSAAARGYWLPLLLFGVLVCAPCRSTNGCGLEAAGSGPAARARQLPGRRGSPVPCGGRRGSLTAVAALGYYWQLAIPAGVVLTVLWYHWRGHRVGLRTPARGFLITGLILGELVLLLPLLAGPVRLA